MDCLLSDQKATERNYFADEREFNEYFQKVFYNISEAR
jgi:hypothetical protein